MELATLLWSQDDIRVITKDTDCKAKLRIESQDRYWLSLFSDYKGCIHLKVAQERCPFWISEDKGGTFKPLDCIPGDGPPIPGYRCKLHRSFGIVTALENNTLWVWSPSDRWKSRQLPQEMSVHDVSFDCEDGLWCAGSVSSQRIPDEDTEAAVRYQAKEGSVFQSHSPNLNLQSALKVITKGGLTELRTIDAEGHLPVATSICSWFLEDESSFVYVFDHGRTYVTKLKAETVRYIDRPKSGIIRVFGCFGGIWQGMAARMKHQSIANGIREALSKPKCEILIRGMDASGEKIAVAVEVGSPSVSGFAQEPEFTAVCVSLDGGKSFELLHCFASGDDAEVLDVTFCDN